MTKLEAKLIELGYKRSSFYRKYIKYYEETDNYIVITLSIDCLEVVNGLAYCQSAFYKQEHIETLQQAFNVMKRDLEVLKEYEK